MHPVLAPAPVNWGASYSAIYDWELADDGVTFIGVYRGERDDVK